MKCVTTNAVDLINMAKNCLKSLKIDLKNRLYYNR